MNIVPAIIDSRPSYLRRASAPRSLLLTPLGAGTLLQHERQAIAGVTDQPLTIFAEFDTDADYVERIRGAGVPIETVASLEAIEHELSRHEPSDWLLVVDTHCFPAGVLDLGELLRGMDRTRAAQHLVAMEADHGGTKEYVQFDGEGRVRRIQRYYEGVTWLQTRAVACSLIPIGALRGLAAFDFQDLATLRETLVSHGVMSRDIGLSAGIYDLRDESGLLRLNEHVLRQHSAARMALPGYSRLATNVWVAKNCHVDPTAKLHGPVIVQEGAVIGPRATIVGPALIGPGCRVGEGAIIAQCLLTGQSVAPPESVAGHRVLCEGPHGESQLAPRAAEMLNPRWRAQPNENTQRRNAYSTVKRVMDVVLSLLGLIILSPLLLVTAALVKLTSPGPALFLHEREGRGGGIFGCCKFRTMVVGAHTQQRALYRENAVDGPQFKMPDDPRVTWFGGLLRASNIDELPQLLNVLRGQMSLIGPRPSPFRENQICVPWRKARLAVQPGITGLWQICRHERSAGDFHQWIYYDMLYVRHMSFWLDFKILLATVVTCGGRWSVPLTWMIPARKLRDDRDIAAPLRRTPLAPPARARDEEAVTAGVA